MMMICTASLQNIHKKQLKGYQSTTEEKKDKQTWPLSLDQMGLQVVAGGRKLNLRLALDGQMHSQVSSQVHASSKKPISKQTYPEFHWL